MTTTVFPTHRCFDDSIEILGNILRVHPDALRTREFVIVHGIVAPYGEDFAHAWVEATLQSKVLFMGVIEGKREMVSADVDEFYTDIKVKETTKYSPLQAWAEERRTGKYGPWNERYRQLCNDRRVPQLGGRDGS